jgi:hypothetical protein
MPTPVVLQNEVEPLIATIAISTSLAPAVALPNGHGLVGLILPAAWTAADITVQISLDNVTFADLYAPDGTEVTLTVTAAATAIYLTPAQWVCARYVKIRSGTTGTPVNQAAARAVTLITKPL